MPHVVSKQRRVTLCILSDVEGWHRAFQANVGAHYPNLWKFVEVLKKEQSLINVQVQRANAGENPPPRNAKYAQISRRIENTIQQYLAGNRTKTRALEGLAYNYMF